jgi:pimeloyl-ACP methyl ester carboxylesterase
MRRYARAMVAIAVGEAAALFANGCAPAIASAAVATMQPEATAPFATPVHTTSARFGTVPRSYITTRNDFVVSPSLQDRMVAPLPCAPVVAGPTGHLPFLAAPDDFAQALLDLLVP